MTLPGLSRLAAGSLLLPEYEGWPETVHELSEPEVLAVSTALAAGRPLLVRGEPGTGKTQLARAAAVSLGRHFVSSALDAHTEARELFWTFDAVRRLSEAQILAAALAAQHHSTPDPTASDPTARVRGWLSDQLEEWRYVEPGVLWWGFNWDGAAVQRQSCRHGQPRAPASWVRPRHGSVVLLDEIDKADPTLPNALLEALSVGRFPGPIGRGIISKVGPEPLVVITTNAERELPPAFMRRCAVLDLSLPAKADRLIELLMRRGAEHAARWQTPAPGQDVLRQAAQLVAAERSRHTGQDSVLPGQAEYLDLLKAVCLLSAEPEGRLELLSRLKPFVVNKHVVGTAT